MQLQDFVKSLHFTGSFPKNEINEIPIIHMGLSQSFKEAARASFE
jgi:hypothetical protein